MKADDVRRAAAAPQRRMVRRLLCSDLITVHWQTQRGVARRETVVIEDYSPAGASLSAEAKIEPGTAITLRTHLESFGALVRRCERRDDGYLLGVEFDQPRLEENSFLPDHLFDPNELGI